MRNNTVNYWLVLIISICFGFLGLDRFIVGDVKLGLLKLFTLGFCGIWWIIDIILFAIKKMPNVTFVTSIRSRNIGIMAITIISFFYMLIFIGTYETSDNISSRVEKTSITSQEIEKTSTVKPTKSENCLEYEIVEFKGVEKEKYIANIEIEKKINDKKFKDISEEIKLENSGFKKYVFTFFIGDSKIEDNKYVKLISSNNDFDIEFFNAVSVESDNIAETTTIKPSETIETILSTEKLTTTPSATPTAVSEEPKEQIVYITETGSKYHLAGCQYLRESKYDIPLSEAISRGYTPCSKCW